MEELEKIVSALDYIDPAALTYDEWKNVGMALKSAGIPSGVFDSWSMRDPDRYVPGEAQKKYDSFKGSGITIATAYGMAIQNGWNMSKDLDWDDGIGGDGADYETVIAQHTPAKQREPWEMAYDYVDTLYKDGEYIGWVNESKLNDKGDKLVPANVGHWLKKKEVLRQLKKYKNLAEVFGDTSEEAGAWIRINPLDGEGGGNANVTRYDYALVESDTMSKEEQKKLYVSLNLPIIALVDSGGKSVHAIVKVEAADETEYKRRVLHLFDVLAKRGMTIDANNKNCSRLSRLPGVSRNGQIQELLALNMGASSWADWIDYMEGIDDDLPEIHSGHDMFENPAPEPPSIIEGVLRQGAKMIVTGDSKSGKTCLLTNLAVCIAEGWEWLGHQCTQGKVLYINMEVMQSDFETRYRSIYKAYGKPASEEGKDNFDFWNLRGKAQPLEKLAPKIIRRCRGKNYLVIIVDPVYKVQGGDENNAEAIGKFCALFDMISEETGASMVYVHHHAKGLQGNKKAMDRGSGSGVFSRDADAIVDFANLVLDPNTKEMARVMSQDITQEPIPLRLEMVLRSFRSPKPVNLFFEFPLHVIDGSHILDNAAVEGTAEANRLLSPTKQKSDTDKKEIVDICFGHVSRPDGTARFADMHKSEFCDVSDKTLKKYIEAFPDSYELKDGIVRRILE